MRSPWLKALLVLAGVWIVAGGAIFWARSAKTTPQSVTRYLETHPVENQPPATREKVLTSVASQMNTLGYEERRELRMSKKLDAFFRSLNPDEQSRFLDLTLPTGFKQMMESLNKMEPAKRKQFVERALRDMKQHEGDAAPEGQEQISRKIIDQGFKSFYSEASAEVKMDVAPLIEQLQHNLQNLR